jgi:hypothetical protein
MSIVDPTTFNFTSTDGAATVVVVGDTRELEAEQLLRVVGVVADPTAGTNLFGGTRNFPVVAAKWIEKGAK